MSNQLTYKAAKLNDAQLLSRTAFVSKQFWGYSDDLMALWKAEIEITEEYILNNEVVKVFDENCFIGFYALKEKENKCLEIDHLWLLPNYIKKGYGKQIFSHILGYAKETGVLKLNLVAEPNAKTFYDKMGGVVIKKNQSKISGRYLDVYEFKV